MKNPGLKADLRKITGRKVKRLRAENVLPANIYGKKAKSQAVQVDLKSFEEVYKKVGETGLVDLSVGGKRKPILIHNVQLDPVSDNPIHADFLQVDLKERVTTQVPIELVDESPAEKEGKGTVVQYIDEVEVEALPGDLPGKFTLNLSELIDVDQSISVGDIKVNRKKVEIKNEQSQIVVKVEPPRKVEEEVPEAPEEEVPEGEEDEEVVEKKEEMQKPEVQKEKVKEPPSESK